MPPILNRKSRTSSEKKTGIWRKKENAIHNSSKRCVVRKNPAEKGARQERNVGMRMKIHTHQD